MATVGERRFCHVKANPEDEWNRPAFDALIE